MVSVAFLAFSRPAESQSILNMKDTNAPVYATALSGNTLYIGGDFTQIGTPLGGGVLIDRTTGERTPSFPPIAGSVSAIAADGAGGWFIGGSFSRVGNQPRTNLAHILADGSVATWAPSVNAFVSSLVIINTTIYIGGPFTTIGGLPRHNLGAIDSESGAPTSWNPDPESPYQVSSQIMSLRARGGLVYAGGSFTSIGGSKHAFLAALDALSGTATDWYPAPGNFVYAMAVDDHAVYAAGFFGIEAYDLDFGSALWHQNQNGYPSAFEVSGFTLYIGGFYITSVGGQARNNLAALNSGNGSVLPWNPNPDGTVSAITVGGSTVYVAGSFTTIGGQARGGLAALDATGSATAWAPDVSGGIAARGIQGNTLFASGAYLLTGGVAREHIAALDVTTGLPTAWHPSVNGRVSAIAVNASTVYLGGSFTAVGGQTRNRIAALDAGSGLATSWDPNASGEVDALDVHGSTVYLGGLFTSLGGSARRYLAAIDAGTGLPTSWNPDPSGTVNAIVASDDRIYVGGGFTTVGGVTRNGIASIDAATGSPTAWDPNAMRVFNGTPLPASVYALKLDGELLYAGGEFSTIGGQTRNGIAALGTGDGLATAWDPNATFVFAGATNPGYVYSLAVNASHVYAGGVFDHIGGQPRDDLAAIQASDGAAGSWDPDVSGLVRTISLGNGNVFAGGSLNSVGAAPRGGIVAMSDAKTSVLIPLFEADVVRDGLRLRWRLGGPERVSRVVLDRAPHESGPYVTIAERTATWDLDEVVDGSAVPGASYFYRLTAVLDDGTRAVFGPIRAAMKAPARDGFTSIAPHPIASSARIQYDVASDERVRISVLDVAGREVSVLTDGFASAGSYTLTWDGRARGAGLEPGIYFLRWSAAGRTTQRRIVIAAG